MARRGIAWRAENASYLDYIGITGTHWRVTALPVTAEKTASLSANSKQLGAADKDALVQRAFPASASAEQPSIAPTAS